MKKYQKVRTVGHREIADLFRGQLQIQEKVDGSNFGFGKDRAGKVFCVSRTQDLSLEDTTGMFKPAVEYVKSIANGLENGTIYRAEYLSKPKHNVIQYNDIPENHLALFEIDYINPEGAVVPAVLDGHTLAGVAADLGISCVPTFFEGQATSESVLAEWENFQHIISFLGGSKIEGIVIKNFDRFNVDGNPLIGKIVRAEFKEQHAHKAQADKPDHLSTIGHNFGGPARWEKAVQRLTEEGKCVGAPEDIGPLMRRIHEDTIEECLADIQEQLWIRYRKDILRAVCAGFPEWYKEKTSCL